VRPYRIGGWSWVASGASPSVDTLKNAIYTYGPIVAYMDICTDFYYYSWGVYHTAWGYYEGGHAILIVGWNDNTQSFTCKNSWGTNWGESGFFRISYNELGGWANLAKWSIAYGDVGPVSVNLLTPTAGEPLASGSSYQIQWEVPDSLGTFKLHYSLDDGTTWDPIADGLTGTTYYDWTVPVLPNNKKTCRVRIQEFASGKKIGEKKSSPFTIEVTRLTSPNGGDFVPSGGTWPITWTTNQTMDTVDKVKLTYTLDNGLTWKPITTLTGGNPGTHVWDVPTVKFDKTKCKVKVVLKDAAGKVVGSDVSDSPFTITPNPF
jgi:hypothetical protein